MHPLVSRRSFLNAGVAATAGLALSRIATHAASPIRSSTPSAQKLGWNIAIAQYTFRRFSLYETLPMLAKLGVDRVETGFFLKLDRARPTLTTGDSLSAELRAELKSKLAAAGVFMPGYYAKVEKDEAGARAAFQFAKDLGASYIVAEPPIEAMDMVEKLCNEFEINLAIHNHPKSPKSMYWNPDSVLASCRGRGKRIGACCDTGHWVRSALDPLESFKKMEGRILGIHLKDVGEVGNPKADDVPLGTGKANYAELLKELHRQGYKGVMSLEYEHDPEKGSDPTQLLSEVSQCLAFVERTAAAL